MFPLSPTLKKPDTSTLPIAISLSNAVLEKVDEIVKYIEESDNYKKYKEIEKKLENDSDIIEKVDKIKTIQKEIVKLEVEKKDISKLEKEIEDILSILNTYPIYQEFIYLQEDLDSTFQSIKTIIENYINDKLK